MRIVLIPLLVAVLLIVGLVMLSVPPRAEGMATGAKNTAIANAARF